MKTPEQLKGAIRNIAKVEYGDGSGTLRTVPNRSKRPTFHNDRKKVMCYTVDSLECCFLEAPLERRSGT